MMSVSRKTFALFLGIGLWTLAAADLTTLTGTDVRVSASGAPVVMQFPVTRSGDLSYDAVLDFHTEDATAVAGSDYTATSGSIVIPAGSSTATIPVTLSAHAGNGPDLAFQLKLDGAGGIGPAPNFSIAESFPAVSAIYSVAVADLNSDGKVDLVGANFNSNSVSVLLNATLPGAAIPTFAVQQAFATGTQPRSVTTADINGDGKPDVIVANASDHTVSVLLNLTAPGASIPVFASQQVFATEPTSGAFKVEAADLNGDGRPDLVAVNYAGDSISVLINTTAAGAGTPSFSVPQQFVVGIAPTSIAVADMNGDGKPDLAVAHAIDSITVLLNMTVTGSLTASFANQPPLATGSFPGSVSAFDVNGDGKQDLAVANYNDRTVSVFLNESASGNNALEFSTERTFDLNYFPQSIKSTDINGDGKLDLVVSGSDRVATILINITPPGSMTPSFASHAEFPWSTGFTLFTSFSVNTADINGDGKPDLVSGNVFAPEIAVVLNITAAGAAVPRFATQHVFSAGSRPSTVVASDIDGDGKLDLVSAGYNGSAVSVLVNSTQPGAAIPAFAGEQTFGVGSFSSAATAADLNGDGKLDLIATDFVDATVSAMCNTTVSGAAALSFSSSQTFATGSGPTSVAVKDLNRDGKLDLVVANSYDNSVSVLLNVTPTGSLSPIFSAQQAFATGSYPRSVAAGDFNGDGKFDVIVADQQDNTISILVNTSVSGAGTPTFASRQTFPTGTAPNFLAAIDIDRDGKLDVVVTNFSDNTVSVFRNTTTTGNATLGFATQQTFTTKIAPSAVAVSDVDGDGKLDLVVTSTSPEEVSVLINNTTTGSATLSFAPQQAFAIGSSSSFATAADLNGDGRPDLSVANYDSISILLNTQYQALISGSPATGTIAHDFLFANGFD